MAVAHAVLAELALEVSARDITRLMNAAVGVDKLESQWLARLGDMLEHALLRIIDTYEERGRLPRMDELREVDEFFLEHAFSVMMLAFRTEDPDYLPHVTDEKVRMAKGKVPAGRIPVNAEQLRILWDFYRKRSEMPPRQQEIARRVKRAFLDKAQEIFVKHSEEFRAGGVYDRKIAYEAMRRRFAEPFARAKMTVETETTRYYNAARREIYDASPDVTHYLFVPVRDYATTPWCKDRKGLVYAKGDPLLDRETPPVHWSCRSELLPLTPQNEQHRELIENKKRWRRNHTCTPLPPGWNKP